jgi:hypothetical protein
MSDGQQQPGVVPIEVHVSGAPPAAGQVMVGRPGGARRIGEAALMVLAGAVVAVLLLPVPLIHLFGIGLFVTSLALAVRRIRTPLVIRSARGTCPHCGAEGAFFVGFGRRRLRFPVTTSCGKCAYPLTLDRPGPSGPA